MNTTVFSGAQFIAVQAGVKAGKNSNGGDMLLDLMVSHKSHVVALVLSIIFSALYTLGGIYCNTGEAVVTCTITILPLYLNLMQYIICIGKTDNYKMKDKVSGAVYSALIALVTFVPVVYFLFAEAKEYVYQDGVKITEYDTAMLIISGIVAVIGLVSVILPTGYLFELRHKCRVWGKKSVK